MNKYLKKAIKLEIKKATKSVEDYTKAIKLNPNDSVAYNNRGNCLEEAKRI